jgi:hypothetical protein
MRRACVAALLAGVAAGAVQAAEPKAAPPVRSVPAKVEPVDAELLEFLGSLDTEEEEWREYLEDRPIKAAGKPVEKKPPPPPDQPDPKQLQQVKKP